MFELPEENLKMLNKILKDITILLDMAKIKYWADGGTMLGCVRDKGQIKHDDDCDIGILHEDKQKVINLFPIFHDIGYHMKIKNGVIKVFVPNMWGNKDDKFIKTPTLDIFIYCRKGDKIVLYDLACRNKWKKAMHFKKDIFPLVKMPFDAFEIWMPKNPIPYLYGSYGDDCLTTYKDTLDKAKSDDELKKINLNI